MGAISLAANCQAELYRRTIVNNYTSYLHVVDNFKNAYYNRTIMDFSGMNAGDWVAVVVGIIAIISGFAALIRYIAKNALIQELEEIKHELKPNSGSSIKDQITRVEENHQRLKEENLVINNKIDKVEEKVDKMFTIILKHFGA